MRKASTPARRAVEQDLCRDLAALRARLIAALRSQPLGGRSVLPIAKTLLDRLVLLLFCEDMGLAPAPEPLRDALRRLSARAQDNDAWPQLCARWRAAREVLGGWGEAFAQESDLDDIYLPNCLFFDTRRTDTLWRLAIDYRFGAPAQPPQRSVGPSALGAVFERSIGDLERLQAELDGRSLEESSTKRKREGVFFTPEWVVAAIIDQTLGARLDALRRAFGLDEAVDLAALRAYEARMCSFTVLDPACGAGVFLVAALLRIAEERRWIAEERCHLLGQDPPSDDGESLRLTARDNLYGVDRNPDAVALTRLVLGLHILAPGRPIAALNLKIRCGDSLVDPTQTRAFAQAAPLQSFDWQANFPEVFARGGFDCVLGNPPYVKLQRLRQRDAPLARYLADARRDDGGPLYRSTQSGGFDLYLPFVERGLSLLRGGGKMGFIAPSAWLVNAYGAGLRRLIHETGALERWVDFGGFQVFDAAVTYTALQLFTRTPNRRLRYALRPDGALHDLESSWEILDYVELDPAAAWHLLPGPERSLMERLQRTGLRLDDPALSRQIFQGLITSADAIFHLRLVGTGQFRSKKSDVVIEIEEEILRPLVSGSDVRRYVSPEPAVSILFPYAADSGRSGLLSAEEFQARFPKAWAYLRRNEATLRAREGGKFDDAAWYRFGRNQSIDKQPLAKLMVPRLVRSLACAVDTDGAFFLDNVDVGGVLAASDEALWFLAACINSPVLNFVWRRSAKPFQNGYRSANKQFIAPLPIPNASAAQMQQIGDEARALQALYSRRDSPREAAILEARLNRRLFSLYGLTPEEQALVESDGLT